MLQKHSRRGRDNARGVTVRKAGAVKVLGRGAAHGVTVNMERMISPVSYVGSRDSTSPLSGRVDATDIS